MQRKPLNIHLPVRLISLLAVCLLLLPLLFLPLKQVIFFSQSAEIRKMEPNSGKLEKMVFTASAFSRLVFTRDQREFIYRGNMYDVHSITRSGSVVEVLALWDAAESGMMLAFQAQDETGGPAGPAAGQVGFMPYFQVNSLHPGFQVTENQEIGYHDIPLMYSDPHFRIPSPPPELLT